MLHIAPEPCLSKLLASQSNIDYLSADLDSKHAMVKMDLTDIQYPENSFDVIYASHVLEHIPNDTQAMSELHRVLILGGWAILQVPQISREKTFEDPSITSSEERLKVYGQKDHVRRYGFDYKDRLENAGFKVKIDSYAKTLPISEIRKYGLGYGNIYFCTK